ncbi:MULTISPECIES: hypothetical protein [unclassified Nocardioides]|jgi:hypothetical protein|uniref:hypothetical protein n=1 Tax=unclassified Nocardioides TaxID=2615069 RepID=UPI0011509D7F|nr:MULTISPECIES: hypothetical protein [unclassified Nocardioides]TQK69648.1 hypothetical protein FBY23_1414 [Nocardioides sp. SLBN-35]WGY01110.1 hypothetical protein QI633_21545 [Nocardioides sp. QY071]
MRRTSIAGLVAALVAALVLTMTPAAVQPATAASSARHGWSTVHKRVGAKIQVCQHKIGHNWGLEMRLDARKAKHRVRARVRIQFLVQGTWQSFPGASSPWRRDGIVRLTNFFGSKTQVLIRARIRTKSDKPPLTGWIDVSNVKHCP